MAGLPAGDFLNAEAIYKALRGMGLSDNAASGVAGNVYQESKGDPKAYNPAGGGLFGLTNANGGNPHGGSLTEQLALLFGYIKANGSIADVNAHASTPTEAATYFSQHYERPGDPQLQNRIAAANWVSNAAKSGNWGSGISTVPDQSGGGGGVFSWPQDITGFFTDADTFVTKLLWLVNPASWVRIGAFLVGVALLLFAIHALIAVNNGQPIVSMPSVVPVPV
jgi:Phage tail lysozyme